MTASSPTTARATGIIPDNNNQVGITNRFYTQFPDAFDEVIVFTTFDDTGASGALAYEMSSKQDVKGIGRDIFDGDGDGGWGGDNDALYAFVDMMRWSQYQEIDRLAITDPALVVLLGRLGQEFAHRWLSFLHYKTRGGVSSAALLGRDMAHWACTVQADASVMDGNLLVDNGDGSFGVAASFSATRRSISTSWASCPRATCRRSSA